VRRHQSAARQTAFSGQGDARRHNGLRDIQNHLGTNEYSRLRIGVGAPDEDDTIDHVLGRFRPGELPVIEDAVVLATQAVCVWINKDIQACMNQYNSG